MWIRPSLTRSAATRCPPLSQRLRQRGRTSRNPVLRDDGFLPSRDFTDALQVVRESGSSGLSSSAHVLIGGSEAPSQWMLPFQALSLAYAIHPALRSLVTSHALLLKSLDITPDLLQRTTVQDPCGGNVVAMQLQCVRAAQSLVSFYNADVQRVLAVAPQQRHLVDELRIVSRIATNTPHIALLLSSELNVQHGQQGLSDSVLWTLLSVPCAPEVLSVLLHAAVRRRPAGFSARDFQTCAHALLRNDNFFCEQTFPEMHRLLHDVLLASLCTRVPPLQRQQQQQQQLGYVFDYVAVRWTPLMNKLARVYTKNVKGPLLHDCLRALLRAVPAAETKLPSSFYVRLLGALLDANGAAAGIDAGEQSGASWAAMKSVAADALRLFGRNPADLRAIWVLLLKAALTVEPLWEDHQRLLESYHLCAQCGHTIAVDRQGFLQMIRLVSAAVCALPAPAIGALVRSVNTFLCEQDGASFLWLLDGVGTLLTNLWQSHGVAVRSAAEELLTVLEKLLRDRRVTGVDVRSNPVIARALHSFGLGDPIAFWWTCGCGEELPSTSRRCTACLRSSGASWLCPSCKTAHKTSCKDQACACGQQNPRLAAATRARVAICSHCGDVKSEDGACLRCEEQRQGAMQAVECLQCHTSYKANALHCPQCFSVNPNKPPMHLWHCTACDDYNYSIWSACRTCKAPRKSGALWMPFVPWACGCGALNHPGRLTCSACGNGSRHHTFTCAGCDAHVALKSLRRVALTVNGTPVSLHVCPHCSSVHPRDDLVLYSPSLLRTCMFCSTPIAATSLSASGGSFHHCGVMQSVNENYVFQCQYCDAKELQTGYHCAHCLFPRPEVEALLRAGEGDGGSSNAGRHTPAVFTAPSHITSVWRCLHETSAATSSEECGAAAKEDDEEDGQLCGQWNYGWSAHCVACGAGRPDSAFECRAKAAMWTCETCGGANRPIDVLFCPHCHTGLQPVQPCVTCGLPHLSYACRVQL